MAKEDNTMGVLAHILGIITGFLGPLILYLVMEDKKGMNFKNTKNALNFQLSVLIYAIISGILTIIVIGALMLAAISIMMLIFGIMGAVKASEGKVYEYPLTIKFLK